MNPVWENVEDWFDLASNIWIGLVVISAAAVPSWLAARNHKTMKKVQDQVVNGHKTMMRADMDDMRVLLDLIKDAIHEVKTDVIDLRKDLREERHCRFDLERRFGHHLDKDSKDHVTEQDWHDGTTTDHRR